MQVRSPKAASSSGERGGARSPTWLSLLRFVRIAIILLIIAAALFHDKLYSSSPAEASLLTTSDTTLPSKQTKTVTATTKRRKKRPRPVLHLIGERHSGTKFTTYLLQECFNHTIHVRSGLTRWKHWFQQDGVYTSRSSVVVVQFRHIHQWVEAMRINPYHSPAHFGLTWKQFVTKPWTMKRYGQDTVLDNNNNKLDMTRMVWNQPICQERFRPNQVLPCLEDGTVRLDFGRGRKHTGREVYPLYELRLDGSGNPYDSVLDLRRDKIRNFLSIRNFVGVQHLEVVQYEQVMRNGTASLIHKLEQMLGVKAQCKPTGPQKVTTRPLSSEYVEWMRQNVDWEAEALIGYHPK